MSSQEQNVTIRTQHNEWIIPHNCELLKALLTLQGLAPEDLVFNSAAQCKSFIRHLLLLAARDELVHEQPSPLAEIARGLIQLHSQADNHASYL
jgi:hypothetical protein